jgi:hypothetical protein
MTMGLVKFSVGETCTAALTMPPDPTMDEHYGPAVCIGHYGHQAEIWIANGDNRINVPVYMLEVFIKELRRAAKLAKEPGDGA